MTWILGVCVKNIQEGCCLCLQQMAFNSELMRKPSGKWGPQLSEHLTYSAPGGRRRDMAALADPGHRGGIPAPPRHVAHVCLAPVRSQARLAHNRHFFISLVSLRRH